MNPGNNSERRFQIRIDEQTFNLNHPEPTGAQLLALVGKTPDKFLLTLVIPNEPDRLVDPEETVDISAPGTEHFALVSKERNYTFRIDERSFNIPNRTPNGRELLALVGKSPETHLLTISLADKDDELIDPNETVDLSQPGREQFYAVVKNPLTITIDGVAYQPAKADMSGTELRSLPPVPAKRDLWLDVPGKDDLRVKPEDTIHLTDGMVFYTSPGKISPGGRRHEIA